MRAFGPLREDRRMSGFGERRRAGGRGKGVCLGKGKGRLETGPGGARAQSSAFELMRAGGSRAIAPTRGLDRLNGLERRSLEAARRRQAEQRREDAQHGHRQNCQEPRARE